MRPLFSAILRHYPFYEGYCEIALSRPLAALAMNEQYAIAKLRTGQLMLVHAKDHVGRTILYMGDYEPRISYLAKKLLRPGDCVLDVGANLGWFSLISSQAVGPSGCVHAFEPQPRINDLFRASLAMNGASNVALHEVALTSVEGTARFNILAGNYGAGRLDETDVAGDLWSTIQVRTAHAGDYLESLRLPNVRLVKIDVEGHEETVFRSADGFFRTTPPDAIIFESAGSNPLLERPVAKTLRDYGYDLFSFDRSILRPKIIPAKPGEIVPTLDHLALRPGIAV